MPSLSKEREKELLLLLGWKTNEGLWLHPDVQSEWGEKPNIHDPIYSQLVFSWILNNQLVLRISKTNGKTSCILRKAGSTLRWTCQDWPENNFHLALISVICKYIRDPQGRPKTEGEFLRNLFSSYKKGELEKKKNNILSRLEAIKSEIHLPHPQSSTDDSNSQDDQEV